MNRVEHLLSCLVEETTEIGKDGCKALRFGLSDKLTKDPYGPRGTEGLTNAEKIHDELIDLLAVYVMLASEGVIPPIKFSIDDQLILQKMMRKTSKVEAYMNYATHVGTLQT